MDDTDEELLGKIALGGATGRAAFDTLYRRHQHELKGWLAFKFRLSETATMEIVQDTFFSVWKSAGSFRGGSQVRTWIHQIAKYRCFDVLKEAKRWDSLDGTSDDEGAPPLMDQLDALTLADREALQQGRISDQTLHAVNMRRMADCFSREFPAFAERYPQYAKVLDLYEEGWSGQEIAQHLSRSEPAARKLLQAAREKQQQALKPCIDMYLA